MLEIQYKVSGLLKFEDKFRNLFTKSIYTIYTRHHNLLLLFQVDAGSTSNMT